MDEVRNIPASQIRHPKVLMRMVDRNTADYLQLRDSIKLQGLLCAISVRVVGPDEYEVIAGNHRFTVMRELRWEVIPCIVKEMTDVEALAAQVVENSIRIAPTDNSIRQHLRKIKRAYPQMTLPELCQVVSKSADWVREKLGIHRLKAEYVMMLDRGELSLDAASLLNQLPQSVQTEYIDAAAELPISNFRTILRPVIKKFWETVRTRSLERQHGTISAPIVFIRSMREILNEWNNKQYGPVLLTCRGARTAMDGFYIALEWVLSFDEQSRKEQRQRQVERLHQDLVKVNPEPEPEPEQEPQESPQELQP